MIVLKQFLSLAQSQLTVGCLLKKVNTPARNLPVPAKGQVIAMEGSGLGPLKVVLLSVGQTLKKLATLTEGTLDQQ